MILRKTMHLTLALAFGLGALSGCLDQQGETGETGETGDDTGAFEYAGFALSADDQSDDGFDEDADYDELLAALGDAFDDDDEAPGADEVDSELLPAYDVEETPDRIARTVLVLWGKPTLDADFEGERTIWRGQLWSNVAALVPLRKIAFEANDVLVRDGDRHTVSFRTVTGPHHDGVLIRLVAPRDPETLQNGVLSFRTPIFQKTVRIADLLNGFDQTFRVDDSGNALHIATVQPQPCPHGLLRLRWHRVTPRGGVLGGRFYNHAGEVIGGVAGLWGRVDGKRRFKGVFFNGDLEVVGRLRGAWAPHPADADAPGGLFRGEWFRADRGVGGVMRGMYRVGPEPGQGSAHGGWRANCAPDGAGPGPMCDPAAELPEPEPAQCACDADEENGGEPVCGCASPPPAACQPAPEPAAAD